MNRRKNKDHGSNMNFRTTEGEKRTDFDGGDAQAASFEDDADAAGSDSFAEAAYDASSYQNVLHFLPCESCRRGVCDNVLRVLMARGAESVKVSGVVYVIRPPRVWFYVEGREGEGSIKHQTANGGRSGGVTIKFQTPTFHV